MAVLLVVNPNPHAYVRTTLHGINKARSYAEFFDNLRMITAVLLAQWSDTNPDLSGVRGDVFDVLTTEIFYRKGYAKTKRGSDERLWFCDYIGFEKVTSQWAKTNHPDCRGYISMRIHNQDQRHLDLEHHTVILYF